MAQTRTRRREPQRPELIVRAKIKNFWQTLGGAWRMRGDEHGWSVQLNVVPVNWDGRMILIHPLPDEEQPEVDEPAPF